MAIKLDNIPGMESILPGQQQPQSGQPYSNPIAKSVVTHAVYPTTQPATDTTKGTVTETTQQPKKRSYVQIMQDLMPEWDPEKMKADIEADKKRQKRQAIFAAIGDGVTALSNLFFTTKGSPNMYDASKGMAAGHTAYWDKVKAERDRNHQQYLNAYLTAAGMDAEEQQRSWLRENTEKQQQFENGLKAKAENRAQALHDLDVQLRQGQITTQQYTEAVAKANADVAPKLAELSVKQAEANIGLTGAQAAAHAASMRAASGTFTEAEKEWIRAAAKRYGIPTTRSEGGKVISISIGELAGALSEKLPPSLWPVKFYDIPEPPTD